MGNTDVRFFDVTAYSYCSEILFCEIYLSEKEAIAVADEQRKLGNVDMVIVTEL